MSATLANSRTTRSPATLNGARINPPAAEAARSKPVRNARSCWGDARADPLSGTLIPVPALPGRWPAFWLDIVYWVEQQQLLHVGVLVQSHRSGSYPHRRLRSWRSCARPQQSFVHQLGRKGCHSISVLVEDRGRFCRGEASSQQLPRRISRAARTEIGASAEMHDEDFAVDTLVDDIRSIHFETLFKGHSEMVVAAQWACQTARRPPQATPGRSSRSHCLPARG